MGREGVEVRVVKSWGWNNWCGFGLCLSWKELGLELGFRLAGVAAGLGVVEG